MAPVSRDDLDEAYSCRVALEGLAAAQAAERRKKADVTDLEAAIADMEAALDSGDTAGYFRGNLAFTDAIHAAADNATLRRLLERIGKQSQRYRYLAYSDAPDLMTRSLAGSRDILRAVIERDPVQAREITECLIKRSWQSVGLALDRALAGAKTTDIVE